MQMVLEQASRDVEQEVCIDPTLAEVEDGPHMKEALERPEGALYRQHLLVSLDGLRRRQARRRRLQDRDPIQAGLLPNRSSRSPTSSTPLVTSANMSTRSWPPISSRSMGCRCSRPGGRGD